MKNDIHKIYEAYTGHEPIEPYGKYTNISRENTPHLYPEDRHGLVAGDKVTIKPGVNSYFEQMFGKDVTTEIGVVQSFSYNDNQKLGANVKFIKNENLQWILCNNLIKQNNI